MAVLESVIDPELGSDIVSLGMVPAVSVSPAGDVDVTVKLTIGGCPLRADIKREIETRVGVHPGVRDVHITWGEMTPDERTEVMLKARWNARQHAGDTQVPASTRVARHRQRQGRRRQELGHRQPRRRPRPSGSHGRRARRRHLGLLGAPPARHERAHGGRAGRGQRPPADHPQHDGRRRRPAQGRLDRLPRRGGHGADVAGPDADQGRRAVPPRRALGRPRRPADRHAAGHRRRPDGPRPAAAAGRHGDRHDAGAGRPEGRPAGRRHGAAQLRARRRRDREHDRLHVRARHVVRRCSGPAAGRRWPPRSACPCSVRCRSSRPSRPAATPAGRCALDDGAGAAAAFRSIADRLDDGDPRRRRPEAPDMAGCSARLLAAVEVALGEPVQSSVS